MCSENCNQGRCCNCGDSIAPFKGLVYGVLLSIPIWIGIGAVVYYVFRSGQ